MNTISKIERDGYCWCRNALQEKELLELEKTVHLGNRPGMRLSCKEAGELAPRGLNRIHQLAEELQPGTKVVRFLVFDKNKESNWSLPWHQDRVIAVADKFDHIPGYVSWTRKSGIWHVEPPITILENSFFARVHLDDCDETNGCLEIAPRSHRKGKVAAIDCARVAEQSDVESCSAKRGDVLFVKALTIHGSKSSTSDLPRRTLRIDFCSDTLPEPLAWAD